MQIPRADECILSEIYSMFQLQLLYVPSYVINKIRYLFHCDHHSPYLSKEKKKTITHRIRIFRSSFLPISLNAEVVQLQIKLHVHQS